MKRLRFFVRRRDGRPVPRARRARGDDLARDPQADQTTATDDPKEVMRRYLAERVINLSVHGRIPLGAAHTDAMGYSVIDLGLSGTAQPDCSAFAST